MGLLPPVHVPTNDEPEAEAPRSTRCGCATLAVVVWAQASWANPMQGLLTASIGKFTEASFASW